MTHLPPSDERVAGAETFSASAADAATSTPPVEANPYWRIFRRLGPAGPLALIAATVPALTGFLVATLPYWFESLAPWLRAHQTQGLIFYVLGFVILGGLAILPTWAHSIFGGWCFGFRAGFPAAVASIVGGATVGYVVGRLASGRRVVELLEEHPKTRAVYDSLLRSGFGRSLLIVTLIRIPPSSPYAVTNLALSCARVNPLVYILGTLLGISPRTGIVVLVGSKLSKLSFDAPHRFLTAVMTIVATAIVLSIIGYLANQAIAQITRPASPAPVEQPDH